ncbi:MAG: hypothetical protein K6E61_06880 [Bacteroidales bacterium]|nr:hypothetical protein [Bacteroidales bacterium]
MRKFALACAAAALAATACIKVDNSLGSGLVDKSLLYDTYTVEFPLTNIQMKRSSDLSGYSSTRVVVGAIRDDVFGLTTRESAFTLIPILDTLDLGTNPKPVSFSIYFAADSVSCADDSQAHIMQNFYATELNAALDPGKTASNTEISHGDALITDGIPVYNGSGPIRFTFKNDFAQKYLDGIKALCANDGDPDRDIIVNRKDWDDDQIEARYKEYVNTLPGIHLRTDEPSGNGGRINLFGLSCLEVGSDNKFYINNNLAVLYYTNDEVAGKDTTLSVVFVPGEMSLLDEDSYIDAGNRFYQFAFNRTTHEFPEGPAGANLYVEGGSGVKPVISAKELYDKSKQAIEEKGGSIDNTIVTKATIVLPYEMPADYREMKYYPGILSPTIRRSIKDDDGKTSVQFAGLTDASVSTENQGDIDRSNMVYSPDISYHVQEILKRTDLDTADDADIWFLTIFTEQIAQAQDAEQNAYLQQLMYAIHYNTLYGGGYGYGGYGGYGSYGYNSYNNYYNYAMLAQMMAAASQTKYTTNTELDKDRYYRAILCGPDAATRQPFFRITFAVSKE